MYTSKAIKAHLYLEGMEIDFSSVTITETVGQPPSAVVSLPPTMHIYNILPKTSCIITVDVEMRHPDTGETVVNNDGFKQYEEIVQFWGELVGYGLNRTATSSEVELTFKGFTDNWSTTPIVPVDSTIPTLLDAQIVGINHYQPKITEGGKTKVAQTYESFGIFYKGFPTLLLGFSDLLKNDAATEEKSVKILKNLMLDKNRELTRGRLAEYNKKLASKASASIQKVFKAKFSAIGSTPKELRTSLQFMAKHFLLNYGEFCRTLTYSLALDTMINYVGSKVTREYFGNNATTNFLSNGMKSLGGTMVVSEVLARILPYMRYTYQEFAAPICAPDTSGDGSEFTLSKIVFTPRPELFAPIVNNTIFDDNIISASFARDLNKEPTRLIRLANPIMTYNNDGQQMMRLSLATVMPFEIVVGSKLSALQKNALANQASMDVFASANGQLDDKDIVTKIETWCKEAESTYKKYDGLKTAEEKAIYVKNYAAELKALGVEVDIDDKGAEEKIYNDKLKADAVLSASKDGTYSTAAKKYEDTLKDASLFDLTREEMVRGVVPDVYTDETGVEYAFLLDIINKKQRAAKKEEYKSWTDVEAAPDDKLSKADKATFKESLARLSSKVDKNSLEMYSMDNADFAYKEHRRRTRSLNLQTDYSPYRVCGYAGMLFIKDIGQMVGVINNITTKLAANGEASQQITFSHISLVQSNPILLTQHDYLDHYTDQLPGYMAEFTVDKVGNNLYTYINGRKNAAVHDFVMADERAVADYLKRHETSQIKPGDILLEIPTIVDAEILQLMYDSITDSVSMEKFIHRLTWRNMATMGQLMSVLKNKDNGFKPRPAIRKVTHLTSPSPFVAERQFVLQAIFNPTPTAWLDKDRIVNNVQL